GLLRDRLQAGGIRRRTGDRDGGSVSFCLFNLGPAGQLHRFRKQRLGILNPALDMRRFEVVLEILLAYPILMEKKERCVIRRSVHIEIDTAALGAGWR